MSSPDRNTDFCSYTLVQFQETYLILGLTLGFQKLPYKQHVLFLPHFRQGQAKILTCPWFCKQKIHNILSYQTNLYVNFQALMQSYFIKWQYTKSPQRKNFIKFSLYQHKGKPILVLIQLHPSQQHTYISQVKRLKDLETKSNFQLPITFAQCKGLFKELIIKKKKNSSTLQQKEGSNTSYKWSNQRHC